MFRRGRGCTQPWSPPRRPRLRDARLWLAGPPPSHQQRHCLLPPPRTDLEKHAKLAPTTPARRSITSTPRTKASISSSSSARPPGATAAVDFSIAVALVTPILFAILSPATTHAMSSERAGKPTGTRDKTTKRSNGEIALTPRGWRRGGRRIEWAGKRPKDDLDAYDDLSTGLLSLGIGGSVASCTTRDQRRSAE